MDGPDNKPLLVLSREGEGRVGLLLSDHIWLWARGFEGGGPHLDLMRRLSHWLMKQPDLEEEALRLIVRGRDLLIERQTMADNVGEVTLTLPSGATRTVTLAAGEPGLWRGAVRATELGLWRATDGKLNALVNVGPPNPREFAEVTSTTETLAPFVGATGGDARRLADASGNLVLPRVVGVRSGDTYRGDDWIGLKMRDASVVRGIGVLPMFAGLLGLLLLVGVLARPGRARGGRPSLQQRRRSHSALILRSSPKAGVSKDEGVSDLGFTRDRHVRTQVGYTRLAAFETHCFAMLLRMRPGENRACR